MSLCNVPENTQEMSPNLIKGFDLRHQISKASRACNGGREHIRYRGRAGSYDLQVVLVFVVCYEVAF